MNRLILNVGLALLVLLAISACPQLRKHHVKFERAGKQHEKLTLRAKDGKTKLELVIDGGYKGGTYELYLQTKISSDYPIEELSIRPDSILIFIGIAQLKKKHIMGGEGIYLEKDKHSYRDFFHFNCPIEQVRAAISANKSNKIKFVFDRFIMYGDTPVIFDTVYAVDTGELTDILNELYPPTSELE